MNKRRHDDVPLGHKIKQGVILFILSFIFTGVLLWIAVAKGVI